MMNHGMPARHVLGALLLEQGMLEKAERVYRRDLEQYNDIMWLLLELYQVFKKQDCLEKAESTLASF